MEDETRRDEVMEQETHEETHDPAEKHELTFDEMLDSNPAYRSEFDRRSTNAVNTARSKWEREQQDNADEAEKLAHMSEAQRERYRLDKDKQTFASEKAAFEREKLVNATASELRKRNLPDFAAAHLTGADAETTAANIERFESEWRAALQSSVTNRMRGSKTPREPAPKTRLSRADLKSMTPAQIMEAYEKGELTDILKGVK